jgi:uncharacterized protein YprB with RNaseH-like and TPR domain
MSKEQEQQKARILLWDIEASNLSADFGITLAFGYKWFSEGEPKVIAISDFPRFKKDKTDDSIVVRQAYEILASADMWVTFYGSRFDVPYMNSRLLYHNIGVLPPIPHLDLYYQAKKLKLHSYRLGSVGEFLGLPTEKTPLSGPVWIKAIAGDKEAMEYIREHCARDVALLEEAYQRLRVLTTRHPRVSMTLEPCRVCGGPVMRRGYSLVVRGEKKRKIRVQCKECGAWETRPASEVAGDAV